MQQTVAVSAVFQVWGSCTRSRRAWASFGTDHFALAWPALGGTPECPTL